MRPLILDEQNIKNLTKKELVKVLNEVYENGYEDGYNKGIIEGVKLQNNKNVSFIPYTQDPTYNNPPISCTEVAEISLDENKQLKPGYKSKY